MEYVSVPGLEKKVSRLFYGTAAAPFNEGKDGIALLDAMLDLGINAIDTARVYGGAEESIGRWLSSSGKRNEVVILSKGAHPTIPLMLKRVNRKAIRSDLEKSLSCLRTDHIDIYLLHRDDPNVPAGEIVEWLNELHQEGKILSFGGSNWTTKRLQEANDYAAAHSLVPFAGSSPNYGLQRMAKDPWGGNCTSATGDENEGERAWYRQTQLPLYAWSSLGGGFFSGRLTFEDAMAGEAGSILSPATMKAYGTEDNFERLHRAEILAGERGCTVSQIALSYMVHTGMNVFPIVATRSAERMQRNIDALDIALNEAECRWLNLEAANF